MKIKITEEIKYHDLSDKELQEYYNTLGTGNTQEHIQQVEKELENRNILPDIKLKLLESKVTYKKKTTQHTFEVNGKEIRVYEHSFNDMYSHYEYETEIDERDREGLTDEETEYLEDNLQDLIDKQ